MRKRWDGVDGRFEVRSEFRSATNAREPGARDEAGMPARRLGIDALPLELLFIDLACGEEEPQLVDALLRGRGRFVPKLHPMRIGARPCGV